MVCGSCAINMDLHNGHDNHLCAICIRRHNNKTNHDICHDCIEFKHCHFVK
jgi:hypothetical protein